MARLHVKDWKKFQHYKDRKPPWIKLHRDVLDNFEYARLPIASKALAPCIWILASESADGTVTDCIPELAFRLRFTEEEVASGLNHLITSGFIIAERDASGPLAGGKQLAALETETETETEQLPSGVGAKRPRSTKGTRLASDWKPSEEIYAHGAGHNLTRDETTGLCRAFFEHFHDNPDAKQPVKKDWNGACKRWITRDAARVVANRPRGNRPQGNAQGRASATSIRDQLRAQAGIQPGGNDHEVRTFGRADQSRFDRSQGYSGTVIDADFTERSDRPSDGIEADDAAQSGGGVGPVGAVENLPEQDRDVPPGRGAACAENPGGNEPLVACVGGTEGAPGTAHVPPQDDAGSDFPPIPDYLKRTA